MEPVRILVPLDGTNFSGRIIPRLRPLLLQPSTEVHLIVVAEDGPPPGGLAQLEAAQWWLARQKIPSVCHQRRGDPAEQILGMAETLDPALLAMATHGRSGASRFLMGSVAERVVRHARHPVFLANPRALGVTDGEDGQAMEAEVPLILRRVLVPLDGSALAAEVLPIALRFAKPWDAEVVLLHVAPVAAPFPILQTGPVPLLTIDEGMRLLEPWRRQVEAAGLRARSHVVHGLPAARILEIAELEAADLLACATHGRTGAPRWLLGSVAEKLIRGSPCPVLVHRPAALAAAAGPPTGD